MYQNILFSFLICTTANRYVFSSSDGIEESYKPCGKVGDGKICVPFYLCNKNGAIIIDGTSLMDVKSENIIKEEQNTNFETSSEEIKCLSPLDMCCSPNANRENTNENHKKVTESENKHKNNINETCGRRNIDEADLISKVQKESEAKYAEFPWMIAVLEKRDNDLKIFLCGGSLIHPKVILTAAQSVKAYEGNKLIVRAGEWDIKAEETIPLQEQQVQKVLIHPQFSSSSLHNDIALLITPLEFNLNRAVNTICLPPPSLEINNLECIATGWGKDKFANKGVYATILKKILLPIVPNDVCQEKLRKTRLSKFFQLHPSFICAGGEIGVDTCKGDGGGPLVCPIPDKPNYFYQVGITAWGIGCKNELPGVYVNVAYLREWIDEVLDTHNLS